MPRRPWLLIWDDHEVENDWGGNYSESISDPEKIPENGKQQRLRPIANILPLRLSTRMRQRSGVRIHQRTVIGDLIEFNLLDCRQYRDQPPCQDETGQAPHSVQALR